MVRFHLGPTLRMCNVFSTLIWLSGYSPVAGSYNKPFHSEMYVGQGIAGQVVALLKKLV
jgi:hypothetical protein